MSLFRKIVLYSLILLIVGLAFSHSVAVHGQGGGGQDNPLFGRNEDAGNLVWSQHTYVDWSQATSSQIMPDKMSWEVMEAGEFDDADSDRYVSELAVFDADGDGDPDIATITDSGNYLYLNNGRGQYALAEAGDFDDERQGSSVLLVFDADGDGDKDILTDKQKLFLNNGAGHFTETDADDISRYQKHIAKMVALDADGDGDIDVAVTPTYGRNAFFVNDGHGNFILRDAGEFDDNAGRLGALLSFDADGDGDADLLGGPGQLYLNDGSGHFTHTEAGEFDQLEGNIETIISFDMDNDGDLDLVVNRAWYFSEPILLFFANDGAGKFSEVDPGDPADEINEISMLSAFDADNDGDMDLAVASTPGRLYLNDGAGKFTKIDSGAFGEISRIKEVKALDADGDGVMELAIYAWRGNFLSILLQNHLLDDTCVDLGYQGFSKHDQFGITHHEATDKAVFDVDGDGDLDILLTGRKTTLFLNNGHGQYTRGDSSAFDEVNAEKVVAFDADGDGDVDVATGNYIASSPNALLINDGHGVFTPRDAGDFDDATNIFTSAMTAFDADGDGDLDLAITAWLPITREGQGLFLNDGKGVFTLVDAGDFDGTVSGGEITAFDADGDGDLDLAIGTNYGWNRLYLNDGAGHFTRSYGGDFDGATDIFTTAMIAFDADGDGDLDLAASYILSEHLSKNFLYLNDGHGLLSEVEAGDFDDEKKDFTYDLAVVDVDGDGDMDIVSANGTDNELAYGSPNSVFLNDGHARFTKVGAGHFSADRQRTTQIGAFDVDGDGDVDLVAANWPGPNRQYLNDGRGTFIRSAAGALNAASDSNTIAALDVDEDGDLDLAVGNWGRNEFYLSNGTGTYTPASAGDFTTTDVNTSQLLAVDINRDGHTDLVAGVFAGTNRIYLGNGRGDFTLADAGEFDDAITRTYAVAALDVDGDGDLDLAVGNFGEPNELYLNDGSGRFRRVDAGAFDDDDSLTTALAAFDADGDGDIDLAEGNNDNSFDGESAQERRNRLFLNDGAGHFELADAGDFSDFSHLTHVLLPVDLDNDGDLDLVEAAWGLDGLYFNDGSGHFTSPEKSDFLDGLGYTEGIAALDADGDGDMDLLVMNKGIFFNDGTGVLHREAAGDFSAGWRYIKALVAFDADGDGDTDVAEAVWGEDAQYLNRGLYETGVVTSPVIASAELCPTCEGVVNWHTLEVSDNLAPHTDLRYDVLDAATGELIPGYSDLRPDATGRIDLGSIDTAQHPAIRLRAHLADLDAGSDNNDQSPRLCAWSVFYSFPELDQPIYLPMVVRLH